MKRADVPFAAFCVWTALGFIAALAHQFMVAWSALVCASVWSAAGFVATDIATPPISPNKED